MNEVILIGRLTNDPEVRQANDTTVARFSLAVDRRFKREGEQTADFISIVAFGKTAEFIEKYFTKGMKMALTGEIRTGSYTNKDGVKVYTTDVIANNVEFVEKKGEAQAEAPKTDGNGFMNIPDGIEEELPFN